MRTLWLSRIAAVGAFFTMFGSDQIADGIVDALPITLFGPQPEIVAAGLPVGEVIGHEAPCSAGARDVKIPLSGVAP